jgi:hypothetical protein
LGSAALTGMMRWGNCLFTSSLMEGVAKRIGRRDRACMLAGGSSDVEFVVFMDELLR